MSFKKTSHRHQVPFTGHLLNVNQLPNIYYFSWLFNFLTFFFFNTKQWKLGDSISDWWEIKSLREEDPVRLLAHRYP